MKRIILAIDVFGGTQELLHRMSSALRILAKDRDVTVEPVFVSSPFYQSFIQATLAPGEWRFPTSRTQERLNQLNLPGRPRLTVLWEPRKPLHLSVERLLEYASSVSADMIALTAKATLEDTTHPLVGSFAKKLLLDARLPLFVVGCRARISDTFRKILFATDFSHESSLGEVLSLSTDLRTSITLYHKVKCFPSYFTVDAEASASPDCFEQSQAVLNERGEEWKKLARLRGGDLDVVIDNTGGELGKSVTTEAEAIGADLIAMAALSGHIASALFGNVTRDVVSEAKCPVWVIHPRAAEQAGAAKGEVA